MKLLLKLNIIIGVSMTALTIVEGIYYLTELALLVMGLFAAFAVLSLFNLVGIFTLWKRHRFRAFLPAIVYGVVSALWLWGAPFATYLALADTPSYPESFLSIETRVTLEDIADRLLSTSIKEVRTFTSEPTELIMITGQSAEDLPSEISQKLRDYGFSRTEIDKSQSLVQFSYSHRRKWYRYFYSRDSFLPPYTSPVTFSKVDQVDWTELLRIAKEGASSTGDEREPVAVERALSYPHLQDLLGSDFLTAVGRYESATQFSSQEKAFVLEALYQQCQASSRLVERPFITFNESDVEESEWHLGKSSISDHFWLTFVVRHLIDEGTLVYADDGLHLMIKRDPSEDERTKVRWVHVGLMKFLYGDVLVKPKPSYIRAYGGGWYLDRW